jgi:transposase-like protein
MALDQSSLSELLDALRAGGDLDFMRQATQVVLQALIDLAATQLIGAGRYERSEARTTHRNGSRARLLSTKAGDVNLQIAKLRQGSFFPSLLEPRRRIDKALWAVVMEAYVHGVSTRKVDDLVQALGIEAGIFKSEVTRICGEFDAVLAEFRDRPLGHLEFPLRVPRRHLRQGPRRRRVVSKAIVVATGVACTGAGKLSASPSETPRTAPSGPRSCGRCGRGLPGEQLVMRTANWWPEPPQRR